MEQYVVSARKYRPDAFEAVVGQSHVTDTLEHEVSSGHIAQAILFTGPRGVGKTTCARILAHRINEVHTGPGQDYSFNMFELDAASNNSVEDIRRLIDQVRFAPQVGKYKVYIIDEVHMLSSQAFNAFLKTLEEPPAHAVFILATTEKHKVLPTILSRCQVFDFKRITVQDIASHLAVIAKKEGVEAEPDALHVIAEKADGALRDSLSIFDRMAAASQGKKLTLSLVRDNLQVLDREVYFKVLDHLLQGDTSALLFAVNDVVNRGFDLHHFIGGLASHTREVLLCHHPATMPLMDVPESDIQRYADQASAASMAWLARALAQLSEADIKYQSSANPRLHVEVTLLTLAGAAKVEGGEKKKPHQQADPVLATKEPQAEPIPTLPESAGNAEPEAIKEASTTDSSMPVVAVEAIESVESIAVESIPVESEELPTPVVTEVVKVKSPGKKPRRASGFSISAALTLSADDADKKQVEVVEERKMRNAAVDQEALGNAWINVLASMKEAKLSMASLKAVSPILFNATDIRLSVENQIQLDFIEEVKDTLTIRLRDALGNDALKLVLIKEGGSDNAKIVYSPEERFQFLLEKNQHLTAFRSAFKLDIH